MSASDVITWEMRDFIEGFVTPPSWAITLTAARFDDVLPAVREASLRLISVASYDAAMDA